MSRNENLSRREVGRLNGIGDGRLRNLEVLKILPPWDSVETHRYADVVAALRALYSAGWSTQRVGKLFETIRETTGRDLNVGIHEVRIAEWEGLKARFVEDSLRGPDWAAAGRKAIAQVEEEIAQLRAVIESEGEE